MNALTRWLWKLGPANPMVQRVVFAGGSRTSHFLVRTGYLGLLVLLVLIGLTSGGGLGGEQSLESLAQGGAWLFTVIAYGQVILICLLAPLFMAGAIASEQSGKTYNILLTTPMSNLQIVLGSLMGRLTFILGLLLSGLPLFSVVLVFGGVRSGSVGVSFGVAAMTALVVGSVAVTLSVLRAGGRKAVFAFVVAVAAYLVLVYAADAALVRRMWSVGPMKGATTWLTPLHPLLVLESSIRQASYRPPSAELLSGYPGLVRFYLGRPFAAHMLMGLWLSATLLIVSSVRLRSVGQGEGRLMGKLRESMGLPASGAERTRAPRALGSGNPIAWRESHTRGRGLTGLVGRFGFLAVGLIVAAVVLGRYHTDGWWSATGTARAAGQPPRDWLVVVLAIVLLVEIVVCGLVALYMAAGSVSKEREDGTLDILLTTPITPKRYVWGKLRGLVRFLTLMLATPLMTLLLVAGYATVGRALDWPQATYQHTGLSGVVVPDAPLINPEAPVILAMMLVPFIALCVAVGMHFSLKSKGVLSAVTASLGAVGLLGVMVGICGFYAAPDVELIGPIINAFSPATGLFMIIDPYSSVAGYESSSTRGRFYVAVGGVFAMLGYGLAVWALVAPMIREFTQTVRRLSGTS